MLVTFTSSESGTMVMFAEVARPFLRAMGKECRAQGVITRAEMPAAIAAIERHLEACATPKPDTDEEEEHPSAPRVGLAQRAWPLLNMLARTLKSGKDGHILWKAAADFSEGDDERAAV
ncbi:MAG: DUF1840 domain-containing protein [Zoogloeaceae bacterium]|nr:DUF1840 domain-containing protein [Zoogloeaceae bacterium]